MDQEKKPGDRLFETKRGLKAVPAAQKPTALQDYFLNDRLPEGLKRYDVYLTDVGPVLEKRAPERWSERHDQKVDEIVEKARASIEEHGYYMRGALRQADALAKGTELGKDEVFEKVLDRFRSVHGREPGQMVKDWRRARNLPVEDAAPRRDGPEPEM